MPAARGEVLLNTVAPITLLLPFRSFHCLRPLASFAVIFSPYQRLYGSFAINTAGLNQTYPNSPLVLRPHEVHQRD
jgi:hypothetical protein